MGDLTSLLDGAGPSELRLLLAGVEKKLAEFGAVAPARHPGSAVVAVPDGTKHLTSEELENATRSFDEWRTAAKNPAQSRSRGRIWLAFLLLRHGALRLGELLALDDTRDIHFSRNQIAVSGVHARNVLLPESVMGEIEAFLASPMSFSLRGEVLKLDQGYLRRKFYERAKACGLPGRLFNPRVIRHSRAIELLQGGVPLQVVQSFLGQQNVNQTATYLEFSGESIKRIVKQHIIRENKMKTSARNSFTGRVSKIVRDGLLVEVELTTMTGLKVVSVITEDSYTNLHLAEGAVATAIVKAPWVILTEGDESINTSARNKFSGKIAQVKTTAIACEVLVNLADGSKVCALVTNESVKNLQLEPGKDIVAMFKAFAVILNVE